MVIDGAHAQGLVDLRPAGPDLSASPALPSPTVSREYEKPALAEQGQRIISSSTNTILTCASSIVTKITKVVIIDQPLGMVARCRIR